MGIEEISARLALGLGGRFDLQPVQAYGAVRHDRETKDMIVFDMVYFGRQDLGYKIRVGHRVMGVLATDSILMLKAASKLAATWQTLREYAQASLPGLTSLADRRINRSN
jgi:hypothetical protein